MRFFFLSTVKLLACRFQSHLALSVLSSLLCAMV